MKAIKQLLRQPLKTLLGVLLMTLAVAVLCVCVGQALAAQYTRKDLNERFSTVAVASLQEEYAGAQMLTVEEELLQWLEKMAVEHPDIVKGMAPNGVLSAYIPQLQPYNIQSQTYVSKHGADAALFQPGLNAYSGETCYDSAMFVITLQQVSQVVSPMETQQLRRKMPQYQLDTAKAWITYLQNDQLQAYRKEEDYHIYQDLIDMALETTTTEGYTVELTGTITQVLYLPEDMRDPVGMTARLTLTLPSAQEIEALALTPGEQYIVYGLDYFDDYQFFVEYMKSSSFKHISFEPFDPDLVTEPTAQQINSFMRNKKINVYKLYNYVPLEKWQYDRINTVSMTLCAPSNLLPYVDVFNEVGKQVDRVAQDSYTYADADGTIHTLSMEQLNSLYGIPTIARLDGDVEAFLASETGAPWQSALEQAQVNGHGFCVVGVYDMHQLASFALEKAQIGEGREFTADEVASGAKVCMIHELVAQQSGLQIGDTITLSYYTTDYGVPYQSDRMQGQGLLRPSAGMYFSTTPFTETAEYTIVGFWKGDAWPDADKDYYNFSANTVFVPYPSVQTSMEQYNSLPFVAVELENGKVNEFHDLAKRSGYAGRFKYSDQGYSQIAVNFHDYESLAMQSMVVGIVIYVILLLLFLLLYPASQGKTVWTMESLGCNYRKRFGHVLLSAVCVMAMATAVGILMGTLLWDWVVAAMQATTESSVTLQMESGTLIKVAGAQLVLGFVLSALVALWVAMPRGISKRR